MAFGEQEYVSLRVPMVWHLCGYGGQVGNLLPPLRRSGKALCACRIKSKKENQRQVEEQRMQKAAEQQEPFLGDGVCKVLAQLELEERRLNKVKQKEQRNKEYTR